MNEAEEIRLIRLTKRWPLWPRLPMKNYKLVPRGAMPEAGFVFVSDVEANKPIVYHGNIFAQIDLDTLQQTKFDSVESLVVAGWQGD